MDISRAFITNSEPVSSFFRQAGIGYYIPFYQRDYSWDSENIEQLIDDICSGVSDLLATEDHIHFMGTIILVTEKDPINNIQPQDRRALPSRIDNVIDGQQRISTLALLACCLYERIWKIKSKLSAESDNSSLDELKEATETYLTTILEIFSFDLMRGNPRRKPIIIRASIDGWTLNEDDEKHYKSEISSYLARFVRTIDDNNNQADFPKATKKSLVADNLKLMNEWLEKVEKAHVQEDNDYPKAWEIIEKIDQTELWSYQRPDLVDLAEEVKNRTEKITKKQDQVCSLIQLFAFCYYLLERCCFTIIQPISEVRAFDMFQSLNATGTPLTAIETFKPLVVNSADSNGQKFKNSNFDKYFKQIESLMQNLRSASSKNQRTNEYLTLFSSTYDGKKLTKQFSVQRKWLIDKYNECSSLQDKEEFIHQMGDIATYSKEIIYSSKNLQDSLPDWSEVDESERKLASFCLLYLKDTNHRMSHTILSRFYAIAIQENAEKTNAKINFVKACQVVAAFFTLWRSALSTTGLDEIYRKLLQEKISWEKGNEQLNLEVLKQYFKEILENKGIGTQSDWQNKAINDLRYDKVNKVCRFVLFITSHDTIPDTTEPGLMKTGKPGVCPFYLEPIQWLSDDLKSVEHIAPKNPPPDSGWDSDLYENDLYEKIGNLTLLPIDISRKSTIEFTF